MNSLEFLYAIYTISIGVLITAVAVNATFVIPLQIKEAQVDNGLNQLRKQMLLKGLIGIIVGVISILCLSIRFAINGDLARYITVLLIFSYSLGNLAISLIDSKIYRQNYNEENKELHKKIAKLKEELHSH